MPLLVLDHLSRIVKADLQFDPFTYDIDQAALSRAQMMDDKLLVTNVLDLKPHHVVQRYKALATSSGPSGC